MIIIGIDPGTATTGWGVIKYEKNSRHSLRTNQPVFTDRSVEFINFGCIITELDRQLGDGGMGNRLATLRRELRKIIKTYTPDEAVVEQLFFGVNSATAMKVGQARGVIIETFAYEKLPVYEYTGLAIKRLVANHGHSKKKEIQIAVNKIIRVKEVLNPTDQDGKVVKRFRDDAYDAVAAALCRIMKLETDRK
ncbi:MAG: hypothetical protein A2864_01185 [Candidatus Woykebacteria bacterium RIFCSPHIGHO2_01_FULL_39_12]|uniref:Crossover junction endodeoxyribonuclease RuvC n=1 Tax=Candidatus Woykebacteria bacterium RIFCSPHIGHO2_01_FULL_39_12 TaxID=1802599 RepID=A0A1G1WH36_9BACT|nr:MAG: hypothetical protein A2864_01185 [Candidatus Woykebacteria bacterium RIFCSPHIGHO2_01_FULL_39_12]